MRLPFMGHAGSRPTLTVLFICAAAMALASVGLLSLHLVSGQQTTEMAPQSRAAESVETLAPPQTPDVETSEPAAVLSPASQKDEPLWQTMGEFYPEHINQLKALRQRDPRRFAQVERQWRPWLGELRDARAQNPELAQLMVRQHRNDVAIREWQGQYSRASQEQRQALLEEGRNLADARVDLRQQRDRLRIQVFEVRLRDLKAGLTERQAHKSKIVDRELEAMKSPTPPSPRGSGSNP